MIAETPKEQAPAPANPLHKAIAENVRADSRSIQQPTNLELVGDDGQPLDAVDTLAVLADMANQAEYADIRHLALPNGQVLVYSQRFITDAYARLHARIIAGDRLALVAETVRLESKQYPRPTPADVFLDEPYHLSREELDAVLAALPTAGQYDDVRQIVASTKRLYLYSDHAIDEQYARSLMEWEEVGRFQNP